MTLETWQTTRLYGQHKNKNSTLMLRIQIEGEKTQGNVRREVTWVSNFPSMPHRQYLPRTPAQF